MGDRPLKDIYPRLFRIACNRKAKVGDFYCFEGREVRWSIPSKRELRVLELESLGELSSILNYLMKRMIAFGLAIYVVVFW